EGTIDEEKFRSLRLARGVYGQRQVGVQMIRIKIPYGQLSSDQLNRIADVSDEYSTGKLHITTRQDIQIHYVSLDRTPELWEELERSEVTLREACGNTVRNVTASETAGIDPKEPFDVSSYADAIFKFFLRNPICQEMGRKFKISLSATDEDTALSYLNDVGLIAKIKDGKEGFKVLLGGGLGSQARHADVVYEFLDEDKIIPFIEGVLRVFDSYGEREKRMKARLKFLIKDLGASEFLRLVEAETTALSNKTYSIKDQIIPEQLNFFKGKTPAVKIEDKETFEKWKKWNIIQQKQEGLFSIGIKVRLGDFSSHQARVLASLIKKYGSDELRLSLHQDILIRSIKDEDLAFFYAELKNLGFTDLGYNSTADITACPGTDTCNLGITNSTGLARALEDTIVTEFPEYRNNKKVKIKISGCMNSCGQHMMAHIGFQGMSVKSKDGLVAPVLQVLLGGENYGNGRARFADKVAKDPSKRAPEVLRQLLNDYEENAGELSFSEYYEEQGKNYFYELLKPLAELRNLSPSDYLDWDADQPYEKLIGIGECAGVTIDLVSTLLLESEEKVDSAKYAFEKSNYTDAIYHAYSVFVNTAKAMLTVDGHRTNSYTSIISAFDKEYVDKGIVKLSVNRFSELIYQIKTNEPTAEFAKKYINEAENFLEIITQLRKKQLNYENN
ncbi:MAG: HEPN domain-containing protein, partial [Flavobacteriales bacterium]|nr:HEPN domain-containing protein [Flavobacteriales bacterium]